MTRWWLPNGDADGLFQLLRDVGDVGLGGNESANFDHKDLETKKKAVKLCLVKRKLLKEKIIIH